LFDQLLEEKRPSNFTIFIGQAKSKLQGALLQTAFEDAAEGYYVRQQILDPEIIGIFKDADEDYLKFLASHPDCVDSVAWEAFERIVFEIFRSKGFEVQHIGKQWGLSADLLALHRDQTGKTRSLIVECKRFRKDRRVGLDIVNAVLGSRVRQSADAAFLVTTSSFTQTVEKEREHLQRLNLELRDGEQLYEWLSFRYNNGARQLGKPRDPESLWIPTGWI
jgi:HJR/Mrr/RecB family endonuclease